MNIKSILLCFVAILMTSSLSMAVTLESQLIKASELVNSRMPMLINKDIRADTTYALRNKFTYIYTLLNESSTVVPQESLSAFRKQMIKGICSHEGLSDFSRRGTKFVYMCRNNQGAFVAQITIPEFECMGKSGETKTSLLTSPAQCKVTMSALIQKYIVARFDCIGMEMSDGDAICFREDFNIGVICNGSTLEITNISNEDMEQVAKSLGITD